MPEAGERQVAQQQISNHAFKRKPGGVALVPKAAKQKSTAKGTLAV